MLPRKPFPISYPSMIRRFSISTRNDQSSMAITKMPKESDCTVGKLFPYTFIRSSFHTRHISQQDMTHNNHARLLGDENEVLKKNIAILSKVLGELLYGKWQSLCDKNIISKNERDAVVDIIRENEEIVQKEWELAMQRASKEREYHRTQDKIRACEGNIEGSMKQLDQIAADMKKTGNALEYIQRSLSDSQVELGALAEIKEKIEQELANLSAKSSSDQKPDESLTEKQESEPLRIEKQMKI